VKSDNSPLFADEIIASATPPKIVEIVSYPEGEFSINQTRVVYAKSGTSLLAIADKYNVGLKRLLDFNELKNDQDNSLPNGQLLYLQRKRKIGANEFHQVNDGESIYDICQVEGIRLESLLEYNHLANGMQPAVGEKLYLRSSAPSRPQLLSASRPSNVQIAPAVPAIDSNNGYTTHVVQTKETLYAISRKYNVPVEKLKEWNKLASFDLREGQELIIYKN
jgi:LysM repeat protein